MFIKETLRKYAAKTLFQIDSERRGRNIYQQNPGKLQAAEVSRGGCWIFREIKSKTRNSHKTKE